MKKSLNSKDLLFIFLDNNNHNNLLRNLLIMVKLICIMIILYSRKIDWLATPVLQDSYHSTYNFQVQVSEYTDDNVKYYSNMTSKSIQCQ